MPILESATKGLSRTQVQSNQLDHPVLREAVILLLERADRRLSLVELLTMVGLADHVLISKVGTPISGDDYLAMPQGPVPVSLLLDMYEAGSDRLWGGRVRRDGNDLLLEGSGVCKKLSKGYVKVLTEAFDAIHGRGMSEVMETVSDQCPEWYASLGKVVLLSDVFVAFGAEQAVAAEWVRELRSGFGAGTSGENLT